MIRHVRVAVEVGDISRLEADVVAVKYARGLFGAASTVAGELGVTDEELRRSLPSLGSLHLVPGQNRIGATQAAFLSVVPISFFTYDQIRQFAYDLLRALRIKAPHTRHLGLTIHGVVFGMSRDLSLRAELDGIIAALNAGEYPARLERITIVERNPLEARQLQDALSEALPDQAIEAGSPPPEPVEAVGSDRPTIAGGFDAFISYKSDDTIYARQVFEFLRSHGLRVFFSRESLPRLGSDEYHAQIDLAVERTRHMVVVTTSAEHAMAQWVQYEWRLFLGEKLAGRKDGNLITVIAGDMRIQDLPISLRNREVIVCVPDELPRLLEYTRSAAEP